MNIVSLPRVTARQIATWRYDAPYDLYNMDDGPDLIAELTGGDYYAVTDGHGDLIGYFCFGESARVVCPASGQYYRDAAFLDIGLGLRRDLTGRGRSAEFVARGLAFAGGAFAPEKGFRLTVAAFNVRAITVYRQLGFVRIGAFSVTRENGDREFEVYTLSAGTIKTG